MGVQDHSGAVLLISFYTPKVKEKALTSPKNSGNGLYPPKDTEKSSYPPSVCFWHLPKTYDFIVSWYYFRIYEDST